MLPIKNITMKVNPVKRVSFSINGVASFGCIDKELDAIIAIQEDYIAQTVIPTNQEVQE